MCEEKKCIKCEETKPITDFYTHGKYVYNVCKVCKLTKARKKRDLENSDGFVYWACIVNDDAFRILRFGKTEVLAGPFESLPLYIEWFKKWGTFWKERYTIVREKEDRSHWLSPGGRTLKYS